MIRNFRARNFKSIQNSGTVRLKPLTILTGPNSSGKSNVLEAIAVLAQATRLPRDIRCTLEQSLSQGEFIRYPWSAPSSAVESIKYKKESQREISFEIEFGLDKSNKQLMETDALSFGYSYKGTPGAKQVIQRIWGGETKFVEVEYQETAGTVRSMLVWPQVEIVQPHQQVEGDEIALGRFLDVARGRLAESQKEPISTTDKAMAMNALERAISSSEVLTKELDRIYLIAAGRGVMETEVRVGQEYRMLGRGAPTPSWVGKTGQHVIEILSIIFGKRKYSSVAEKIVRWTEKFGIGKIGAGWSGPILDSDFEDPVMKVPLEMALASYGSRQLLTMITQLFWSKPGDVIMIEEPEVSLHPESQVLVQELFAEVIKERKQIICTTHSPFFVLALSKTIKGDAISREDVAIYDVEKASQGTKLKPLELDQNGFIAGWIPSYLRVEDELFREWAEKIGSP